MDSPETAAAAARSFIIIVVFHFRSFPSSSTAAAAALLLQPLPPKLLLVGVVVLLLLFAIVLFDKVVDNKDMGERLQRLIILWDYFFSKNAEKSAFYDTKPKKASNTRVGLL